MSLVRPQVTIKNWAWIVPNGYYALTLNNRIYLDPQYTITVPMLAHELMHVLQWRRLGVAGFAWNYGWTFLRDGCRYRNIDLEEEARVPTPEVMQWAKDLIRTGALPE